jgi:hypothetical protein
MSNPAKEIWNRNWADPPLCLPLGSDAVQGIANRNALVERETATSRPTHWPIGGSSMHPLRRLSEARSKVPCHLVGLLAADVVFHSPVFVRPIVGRDKVAAILAASLSSGRGVYTAEQRLDDRSTFLRWAGTIEGHLIESLEVAVQDDRGLIVELTAALRPFPAVRLFREALYPILKDVLPPDLWEYPSAADHPRLHWVMEAGNRFGFLACQTRSSDRAPLAMAGGRPGGTGPLASAPGVVPARL